MRRFKGLFLVLALLLSFCGCLLRSSSVSAAGGSIRRVRYYYNNWGSWREFSFSNGRAVSDLDKTYIGMLSGMQFYPATESSFSKNQTIDIVFSLGVLSSADYYDPSLLGSFTNTSSSDGYALVSDQITLTGFQSLDGQSFSWTTVTNNGFGTIRDNYDSTTESIDLSLPQITNVNTYNNGSFTSIIHRITLYTTRDITFGPNNPITVWGDFLNLSGDSRIGHSIIISQPIYGDVLTFEAQSVSELQQQTAQLQEQTQTQNEIKDFMTDTTPPSVDVQGKAPSVGWLPSGPIDSLLLLPLNIMNVINRALGGTCQPISATLPFVDEDLSFPCMSSHLYEGDMAPFGTILGGSAAAVMMFLYFKHLYKKVSRATSFNTSDEDEWGVL